MQKVIKENTYSSRAPSEEYAGLFDAHDGRLTALYVTVLLLSLLFRLPGLFVCVCGCVCGRVYVCVYVCFNW